MAQSHGAEHSVDSAESDEAEEDYGLIRPSLIKQLRAILDQYPDDGQILKELIQNAEDAGATEVKFLYDENRYPTSSLHDPDMAQFQGSALYAYNNALFEKKDWKGIRMLQASIKEKDPMKVGRFGLGFKSVLHLTDLPSILSGDRLFMIDPHEKYFEYHGERTSGYSWNLQKKKLEVQKLCDQFTPFKSAFHDTSDVFDRGFYQGTLFRFPLRLQESKLSDTLYGPERMKDLFSSFQADAQNLVLFLKNIESIKLFRKFRGQTEPELVYEVRLTADCQDSVRKKRREFVERGEVADRDREDASVTYRVKVETRRLLDSGEFDTKVYEWLVNEYRGGHLSTELQELKDDQSLSLIPMVGVAMPINNRKRDQTLPDAGEEEQVGGQVFCFLPLPVEQTTSTGLPIHVNGYFSVSQNRRHLKWPTAGLNVEADKSVHWNQCLISELLPLSYSQLLKEAREVSGEEDGPLTPADVYRAYPDVEFVDEKWQIMMRPLYTELFTHPLMYTECGGGQWISVADAIAETPVEDEDIREVVTKVCLQGGLNISKVPTHVQHAMNKLTPRTVEAISPSNVRSLLRAKPSVYKQLSHAEKLSLLKFILQDENFQDVTGIELLPRADGTFTMFQKADCPVYIPAPTTPRRLFPGIEQALVSDDLDSELMRKLEKLATAGVCQLCFVDKTAAADLIKKVIPEEWQNKDLVKVEPDGGVSTQWLEDLWDYLRKEHPGDLYAFSGLPILPVNNSMPVYVRPLSTCQPCLLKSVNGVHLRDDMSEVLSLFKIHVVEQLPPYVESHAAVMGTFVKRPTSDDVIAALSQSYKNHANKNDLLRWVSDKLSSNVKMSLVKEVSTMLSMDQTSRNFLQKMPVFPSTETTAGKTTFVAIENVSTGVLLSRLPCSLSAKLLDVSDEGVLRAAKMLGAKSLGLRETLRYIFQDIQKGLFGNDKVRSIMCFVFEHFRYLRNDETFHKDLQDLPFVPVGSRQLKKPSDVCDPQDEFLRTILNKTKNQFPIDEYRDPQYLSDLRELGLKSSKNIQARGMLKIISELDQEAHQADALAKSKCCLQLFNLRPELLKQMVQDKTLLEWAHRISWVPVKQHPPIGYPSNLKWCNSTYTAKPCDMMTEDSALLVGSVKSIIDGQPSKDIMKSFQWSEKPTITDVVKQLKQIVESYDPAEKAMFLTVTASIYQHFLSLKHSTVISALKEQCLSTWMWHGDGFASSESVVLERPPVDCAPYLFALPSEMSQFVQMFRCHGLKERCDANILVTVLSKVQEAENVTRCEQDRNLQMTIDILNYISGLPPEDASVCEVLVPTQSSVGFKMMPLQSCTYCDIDWIRQGFAQMAFDEQDDINFIHPNLPISTAEKLRVPTLMSRMLHADELTITGFGQGEPLTTRLHQLLQDYCDGMSVFKEMIQNADDAGATEVCFLYDERTNDDCMYYLIDDGMKECQGPALWVYNNSVFTDNDFANIIKLGAATKEQEPEKIGRFGLGFNSVYNITDVPSFVSRDTIVIFDPHTTHLGKSVKDQTKPGIKLNMKRNKTLIQKLSDQFKPYQDIFSCDLTPETGFYYNGTLFRLPLRTKLQASRSEISGVHYDRNQMLALTKMVAEQMHNLLHFTQNVKMVKVMHISQGKSPSDAECVLQLEKETIEIIRASSGVNLEDQLKSSSSHLLGATSEFIKNIIRGGKVNESLAPKSSHLTCTHSEVVRNEMGIPSGKDRKHWLVSSCAGQGRSKELSVLSNGIPVPVGGVAMQLAQREKGYIPLKLDPTKTLAFCFLPLPVHTGLPLHINGTFALEPSRRHLCQKTDDDKDNTKGQWNDAVLTDAVISAYMQALHDLKKILKPEMSVKFFEIWPTVVKTETAFHPLIPAFYLKLSDDEDMPVCLEDGHVVTMKHVSFFQENSKISLENFQLIKQIFESVDQCHLLILPASVIESFREAGCKELTDEKLYDLPRFYADIFLPNIPNMDRLARDSLLAFALSLNDESLNRLLRSTACIPCSPDGRELKMIKDVVHPAGLAAKLYQPHDGYFPHGELIDKNDILDCLAKLGMKVQDIMWGDVIERAQSIPELDTADVMRDRYDILMDFIDRMLLKCVKSKIVGTKPCEVYPESEELHEAGNILHKMPFIPKTKKPSNYPMTWKGEDAAQMHCVSISQVYPWESRYLVSASEMIHDGRKMSSRTRGFLGYEYRTIRIQHVEAQLGDVLAVDPKRATETELHEIHCCVNAIYAFLQSKLGEDIKDDETVEAFCHSLHNRPCLLVDKIFHTPSELALKSIYDFTPYLYTVPRDMARRFDLLLQTLDVKKTFETKDFVKVLQEIHDDAAGHTLTDRQLEISVALTSQLNTCMEKDHLTVDALIGQFGEIYIPNSKNFLERSRSLCFDDCEWLREHVDMNFVHPNITRMTSTRLGVKTKQQHAFSKHMRGIPFGQKENLTNALKRIVRTYPCDHGILKEMIQNADDAEATEIHFISDSRKHPTKKILGESWEQLQGPALCVYNNRPFTSEDIEGIQNLGEGSKGSDASKTGRYGIGFSSVYHITDVPSVLTQSKELGKTLCVFDPHCAYIDGVTKAEPGMRFEMADELEEDFPDMFSCYLGKLVDIKESTMMRFPLRTEEMADESKISNMEITIDKICEMLEDLKEELFDILLFANNLEKISVSKIDPLTGHLKDTYTVHLVLSENQRHQRREITAEMKMYACQLQDSRDLSTIEPKNYTYTVSMQDNRGKEEEWLLARSFGFKKDLEIPECIPEAFTDGCLMLMPRGGAACQLHVKRKGVLTVARREMRAFNFLPLPGTTNLPVHINASFALGHENRRHLWMGTSTSELGTVWNNLLCTSVISDAYVSLLTRLRLYGLSVKPCGNTWGVECTWHQLDSAIKRYLHYFPILKKDQNEWKELMTSVYKKIAKQGIPLLPAIHGTKPSDDKHYAYQKSWQVTWYTPTGVEQVFFYKPEKKSSTMSMKIQSESQPKPPELKETLLRCGMKLVEAPRVIKSFITSGVEITIMGPKDVLEFYRSYTSKTPLCEIGKLPCKLSDTPLNDELTLLVVLRYCMECEEFLTNMDGLPLLLTQDGLLRVFDMRTPVFWPDYAELIPNRKDLFLDSCLHFVFVNIDKSKSSAFRELTIPSLAGLLQYVLPPLRHSEAGEPVEWKRTPTGQVPTVQWLQRFWTFVKKQLLKPVKKKCTDEELITEHKYLLHHLSEWCLIPAQQDQTTLLFPVKSAGDVLSNTLSCTKWRGVCAALKKLHVPQLYTLEIEETCIGFREFHNAELLKMLVTRLEEPQAVLHIIHKNITISHGLESGDIKNLLEYFALHVKKLNSKSAMLRDLPLFETVYGDIIPLTDCAVYVLPSDIPTDGVEVWQHKLGIVFLKGNDDFKALYEMLDCARLTVLEVYCQFIFQHSEYFSEEHRLIHLCFVYQKYMQNWPDHDDELSDQQRRLVTTLKSLRFISDGSSELLPASEFYDPSNKVFRAMLTDDKFPKQHSQLFSEEDWRSFLCLIGVITNITPDMFIEYANLIANAAERKDESAPRQSEVLVNHLMHMSADIRDLTMPRIIDIKFVCQENASSTLKKLHPQYGDDGSNRQTQFMAFRNSTSKSHQNLVWTQCGLLPSWANPSRYPYHLNKNEVDHITVSLGIHEEPHVNIVVHHLLKLANWMSGCKSQLLEDKTTIIKEVFKDIYKFLGDLFDDHKETLAKLCYERVLVVEGGTCVIHPSQMVIELYEEDEIRPYLYRIPVDLGEYAQLFEKLGATRRVSVTQYAEVIEGLKQKIGDNQMRNPNDITKLLKALKGLVDTWKISQSKLELSVPVLYFPNESVQLEDTHKLVFNDDPSFYARLGNFHRSFMLNPIEFGSEPRHVKDMLLDLPKKNRPNMLKKFVSEKLVEKSRDTKNCGGLARTLHEHIRSDVFRAAVIRLIRHDAHMNGRKLDKEALFNTLQRLSTIHVSSVCAVITVLIYNKKPLAGSEEHKKCFVEEVPVPNTDVSEWHLYIHHDSQPEQSLLVALANVINGLLKGLLSDSLLYLLPILSCQEDEILTTLDSLNIEVDSNRSVERHSLLPAVGSMLEDDLVNTIRHGDFSYGVGEYVAVRGEGDSYMYGRVEEVLSDLQYQIQIKPGDSPKEKDRNEIFKLNFV